MKRILLGVLIMAMVAALAAPAALAKAGTLPEGCTFEKGMTTCVTSVRVPLHDKAFTLSTTESGPNAGFCTTEDGLRGYQNEAVLLKYTPIDLVTSTNVYKGKGTDKLISSTVTSFYDTYGAPVDWEEEKIFVLTECEALPT